MTCTCGIGPVSSQDHYAWCQRETRSRWTRTLDTIAMVAADVSFSERSAVGRALYAVLLADALNLSPAEASEMACQAAWTSPAQELADKARSLLDEADKAMMDVESGEGNGGRFYVGEHLPENVRLRAAELVNDGRKIQAIKLIREVTGLGLREGKAIAESLAVLPPVSNGYDNEPPF